jgi:putative ATP-dependent endonuclease of OLD family
VKLKNIKIENFCSCNGISMPVSDFTPIIGYNNAGKSNILRAISWLLKKSVLTEARFFNSALPVIVTGEISNVQLSALPANQQTQLQRYLTQGTLRFRRRQELPNAKASDVKIEVLDPVTGVWANNPTGIDNAIGVLFPEPIFVEAMDDANSDVGQFSAKNTIGLLLKNAIEQSRSNNAAALPL